jgi:hypothetical protein
MSGLEGNEKQQVLITKLETEKKSSLLNDNAKTHEAAMILPYHVYYRTLFLAMPGLLERRLL